MRDYSIVEYLPKDDIGYEVVGTTLYNHVMPLIRYKLGDIVGINHDAKICRCGRGFPMIKKIYGREAEFIITPEGKRISIVNHIPWGINNLIEMQLMQNNIDEIDVLVVTTPLFKEKDFTVLERRCKDYISPNINFTIKKVAKIERSSLGKFKTVVQKIDKNLKA